MVAAHAQELLKAEGPPLVASMIKKHRRWTLRNADALLPVSNFTSELLLQDGVPASAVHVCPNGTHLGGLLPRRARHRRHQASP